MWWKIETLSTGAVFMDWLVHAFFYLLMGGLLVALIVLFLMMATMFIMFLVGEYEMHKYNKEAKKRKPYIESQLELLEWQTRTAVKEIRAGRTPHPDGEYKGAPTYEEPVTILEQVLAVLTGCQNHRKGTGED